VGYLVDRFYIKFLSSLIIVYENYDSTENRSESNTQQVCKFLCSLYLYTYLAQKMLKSFEFVLWRSNIAIDLNKFWKSYRQKNKKKKFKIISIKVKSGKLYYEIVITRYTLIMVHYRFIVDVCVQRMNTFNKIWPKPTIIILLLA